jgi:D-ribose pyranase
MVEVGIINRELARVLSQQGHQDKLMVVDAGFAIPKGVEVVDLALCENTPRVIDVLSELKKFFSVEKMIMAKQTRDTSPTLFAEIPNAWGDNMEVEVIEHVDLKEMAKEVKAVIRTGDFTAYGNVILVSGAGDRWYCEK